MPLILQNKNLKLDEYRIGEFSISKFVFEYMNSNMYIVYCGTEAFIVDPHMSVVALNLLISKSISKVTILLTHEHPDHISGVYWFQQKFNTKLICTKYCADYISQEKNVRPILITFVLEERDRLNGTHLLEKFNNEFVPHTYLADITFEDEYKMTWGKHKFEFFKMLGHSKGSCGIILDDVIVFTGDSLMKELPVITRFPGGNRRTYINETLPMLEGKLKSDMWIMPGHGNPFQLKEIIKDGKIDVEFR